MQLKNWENKYEREDYPKTYYITMDELESVKNERDTLRNDNTELKAYLKRIKELECEIQNLTKENKNKLTKRKKLT